MLSYEDQQKLNGMKHIRYKGTEQDNAWKFMLRVAKELQEENARLKERVNELTKKNIIDAIPSGADNTNRP